MERGKREVLRTPRNGGTAEDTGLFQPTIRLGTDVVAFTKVLVENGDGGHAGNRRIMLLA